MKYNWSKCNKECKSVVNDRICFKLGIWDNTICTCDGKKCVAIEDEDNLQIK